MEPIVEVKNLTKKFDGFTAVDDISFEVKEGEILGLLGPNGAGKTTTIQILLGLIKPTSGVIKIFGQNIAKNREEILQKIGFASAYSAMQGKLSLYENLLVYSFLYNLPNKKEKILGVLEDVGLLDEAQKKFGSCSSGQKTRAILAKALLPRPRLLFLDEPTASLDPDIVERIQDLLLRITQKYMVTMLYTSHNMTEVNKMCSRIIFLMDGKIIAQASPKELVKEMEKKDLNEVFISLVREGGHVFKSQG